MMEDQLTPQGTDEQPKVEETSSVATETREASVAPSQDAEVSASEPAADAPLDTPAAEDAPAPSESADLTADLGQAASADVAPADASPAVVAVASSGGKTEDEMLFEAAMASLGSEEQSTGREVGGVGSLTKGERITAKVIQVENDKVFVDLGTKAEGVVPLSELTSENLDTAVGHVQPGDTFEVIVLKTHSSDGNPVVSKRRADFDVQWQRILDQFESGEVFEANVIDRVKGGLVVDIGVRGFVPATHVGSGKLRNIEKYVGQPLQVKIIEVDKERRKVVLSNRVAVEERKDEVKDEIFGKVKPQDVLEGTVRRLTDYGAFVDLGGIDGLLHISEMSWARIDHPREVLKEGDEIKVMVLRLDQGSGRISLGLRQVLPDPWNMIRENYKPGQKVKLIINRMVQSGAFLRLPEGAEAFLPLSEISDQKLKKPEDVLTEGQEVEPTIIDLRADERRMVLSLRENPQVGGYRFEAGGMGANMRAPRGGGHGGGGGSRGGQRGGKKREEAVDSGSSRTAPTGGATIGERLGILKGLMKSDDAAEKAPKAPKEEKAPSSEESGE